MLLHKALLHIIIFSIVCQRRNQRIVIGLLIETSLLCPAHFHEINIEVSIRASCF